MQLSMVYILFVGQFVKVSEHEGNLVLDPCGHAEFC